MKSSSKSRERAEEAMDKLSELSPAIEAARRLFIELLVEYEENLEVLRKYQKRGVVSEEELQRFPPKKLKTLDVCDNRSLTFDSYLKNALAEDEELEKEYDALDMVEEQDELSKL